MFDGTIEVPDLLSFAGGRKFKTVLADPPWQFQNRTGKMAPEHRRLSRYSTMTLDDICDLPVSQVVADSAHLYMWVPNALLPEGLRVLQAWGFNYKSNIVWHKIRKDGGSDGRGVGFYFRNVTELILFGVRGKNARTLAPGRTQVNYLGTRKREHSRKPDEQYEIVEACSPGPFLEMFARGTRPGWAMWGNQAHEEYYPTWDTYAHHSQAHVETAPMEVARPKATRGRPKKVAEADLTEVVKVPAKKAKSLKQAATPKAATKGEAAAKPAKGKGKAAKPRDAATAELPFTS
jgi:N6-adenosine-specific RNA methylase IME4